ncbi:hypothetical protein GW17_00026588 [Ensete ventricosum]|nr:hypothetical protein GW17_00026588 [Ensete ventricosum]
MATSPLTCCTNPTLDLKLRLSELLPLPTLLPISYRSTTVLTLTRTTTTSVAPSLNPKLGLLEFLSLSLLLLASHRSTSTLTQMVVVVTTSRVKMEVTSSLTC